MRCRATAWDAPHLRVRLPNGRHLRLRGRKAAAGLAFPLEDFYNPEALYVNFHLAHPRTLPGWALGLLVPSRQSTRTAGVVEFRVKLI